MDKFCRELVFFLRFTTKIIQNVHLNQFKSTSILCSDSRATKKGTVKFYENFFFFALKCCFHLQLNTKQKRILSQANLLCNDNSFFLRPVLFTTTNALQLYCTTNRSTECNAAKTNVIKHILYMMT